MDLSLENDESNDFRDCLLLSPPTTTEEHDESSPAETRDKPSLALPLPLRLLYGLNGATLSLPITAILYIVNTRAQVPVAYLSAYGAIAFLPWSLKPLYAYIMSRCQCGVQRRKQHVLLVLLLTCSGLCTAATCLIPTNGIVWCFVLAFLRGLTTAWPEFLLGLSLIGHAREHSSTAKANSDYKYSYSLVAAHFQSQAATCRNLGSLVATIVAFCIFIYRQFHGKQNGALSDEVVTALLVTSGILNVLAAIVAWWFQVGVNISRAMDFPSHSLRRDGAVCDDIPRRSMICTNNSNGLVVITVQLCIIVFCLQGPLSSIASQSVWSSCMLLLLLTLISIVWKTRDKWQQRLHRVGLFLIVRHAIPDSSSLMTSYVYSRLESRPVLLQALAIVTMAMTTLSSWSYGKLFARYSQGPALLLLMAGTTTAASLVSLSNLAIVALAHNKDDGTSPSSLGANTNWIVEDVVIFLVGAFTTFAAEWQFLPDVVLATGVVGTGQQTQEEMEIIDWNVGNDSSVSEERTESVVAPLIRDAWRQGNDDDGRDSSRSNENEIHISDSSDDDAAGIQYGTLISCIDFGDQIGAWATVPLVTALGIRRENDWTNLNIFVVVTAILGMLSVLLLGILKRERT